MHAPTSPLHGLRWLPFRNDSGETVPAYGVVRVTGATERHGQLLLTAAQPDSALRRQYALNGPLPVAAGDYGSCTCDSPWFALRGAGSPEPGQAWGPQPTSWSLVAGRPGFAVLGAIDEADPLRMLVRHDPPQQLLGRTSATLTPGSSATIDLYFGGGGAESDSTIDLTAHEWMLPTGESVESGAEVVLSWINGLWYVTAAECPT